MCYIIYKNIIDLNFIKEEDISLIPLSNREYLKRENCYEELKNLENKLKNDIKNKKLKEEDFTDENKLLIRIKLRKLFMKILIEQVKKI
jgi:hypothetical protein